MVISLSNKSTVDFELTLPMIVMENMVGYVASQVEVSLVAEHTAQVVE